MLLELALSGRREEIKKFIQTGELSEELYEFLFEHYTVIDPIMPYGAMKARTGDPYVWLRAQVAKECTIEMPCLKDLVPNPKTFVRKLNAIDYF